MNVQSNDRAELRRSLCADVFGYIQGLGAYAFLSEGPSDEDLVDGGLLRQRDRQLCIRVMSPPTLRRLVMERLAKTYTIVGRVKGADGTSYWACAIPLTIGPSCPRPQTFTLAFA